MDVVRAIQASPAEDEKLEKPVRITSVKLMTAFPSQCRK
jgi:hypothetical protein